MVLPMTGRETLAERVCSVGNVKCWPGQATCLRVESLGHRLFCNRRPSLQKAPQLRVLVFRLLCHGAFDLRHHRALGRRRSNGRHDGLWPTTHSRSLTLQNGQHNKG